MSRVYGIQPWDMARLGIDEYVAIKRDIDAIEAALKG